MNSSKRTPLEKQPVEIVERKGVGHPDSMCDAIMDQVSVELSKVYLKEFGTILHHKFHAEHCPFWKAEIAAYGRGASEKTKND